MPNPYHDAQGRFCSKGEMQEAIAQAQKEGKFDVYFQLRTDYENIEQNKVNISAGTVQSLYGQPQLLRYVSSAKEAEDIYRIIKTKLVDDSDPSDKHFAMNTVRDFLNHEQVSDELKTQILLDLPPGRKGDLLNASLNQNYSTAMPYLTPDRAKILLQSETDRGFFTEMSRSKLFTFEDKYQEAIKYDDGLAILASQNHKIFFKEPVLRKELREKYAEVEKNGGDTSEFYNAFAQSPDESDQLIVARNITEYGSYYSSPAYMLSHNEKLTTKSAKTGLETLTYKNIHEAESFARGVLDNFKTYPHGNRKSIVSGMNRSTWQEGTFSGEPPAKAVDRQRELNDKEVMHGLTEDEVLELQSVTAICDAYTSNWKILEQKNKEAVKLAKREKRDPRKDPLVDSYMYAANRAKKAIRAINMINAIRD